MCIFHDIESFLSGYIWLPLSHFYKNGPLWMVFYSVILAFIFAYARSHGLKLYYRRVAKQARQKRDAKCAELEEYYSKASDAEKELWQRVLDLPTNELRASLQREQLSAADVHLAFRWRALSLQKSYNCLTCFVDEAADWAADLDREYSGKHKPALFGLPFSVKDNYALAGYDNARGVAKGLNSPAKEDSSLIAHLKSLGAIPFCRTNLPQAMLSIVCSNPTYGTTLNPHNVGRTPGGSSGGEAVMVAGGGCVFGINSDLAGSQRMPAHFTGVTTMKSTSGRLKVTGAVSGMPGQRGLGAAYGFFTRDVDFLTDLYKLTWTDDYFNRMPATVPLNFGVNQLPKSPLRIGYFVDDGYCKSTPACARAVLLAKDMLESAGHELVPFALPRPFEACRLLQTCILPDNGAGLLDLFNNEDVDPYMQQMARMLKVPVALRRAVAWAVADVWPQLAAVAGGCSTSLSSLRQTMAAVSDYTAELAAEWQRAGLHALLCPAMPLPAMSHANCSRLASTSFIAGLFNMLDLPAGVVPITHVTASDDEELTRAYPSVEEVKGKWFALKQPLYALVRRAAANSEGLPIGVQIVTQPYREELCLHLMKILQEKADYKGL